MTVYVFFNAVLSILKKVVQLFESTLVGSAVNVEN